MATLMIDNYDSFTYNIYQYLEQLGAHVVVYRNDKITIEECIALNPRNIVISPGPGHPLNSSGISREVIETFAGKIPILGVCLGEQCMFVHYGGTVTYTGEIVHGKTSSITHDGRGLFKDIPQGIQVTRYHSLSGDPKTLPDCLEITSWTNSRKVMGVRHKEYVMEGVQFHPESIASEAGFRILSNFLKWEGGKWNELRIHDIITSPVISKSSINEASTEIISPSLTKLPDSLSSLQLIVEQRKIDIAKAKCQPGFSPSHLKKTIDLGFVPDTIDIINKNDYLDIAVIAEIKRASPSKGNIDINLHAVEKALQYVSAGINCISVFTESRWFKGSLNDLKEVRNAIDKIPDRPAILQNDFIIDPYQILQSRIYGADAVVLYASLVPKNQLKIMVELAHSLKMKVLMIVLNEEEMKFAASLNIQLIGVNNRDLNTFDINPNKTTSLTKFVPENSILVALSGIRTHEDILVYYRNGAKAVLIGESLIKAHNKTDFIKKLLAVQSTKKRKV
ncbi:glutamine amidotransferase of a [Neocallimastix californiae]|uniref:Multifunctional tryptophan biosynthesis protein n=1 Tax=Neocallimastix californiae TaxID=1754190 RepID=A0A1Y2A739_9FUNG|nr:glutamine amidotransferase of a [Neocallimastix californiae]|eukprot:ORY18284.1 glutamine amidotransferase of a [Neocallimastix californiae]